ncbi:hypothetical protein AB0P12_23135 [Streptomyces subrutilus]|uniref:hypothetical protein n=1 Tax=Streptomyces subrutilus TaxID=36818 RepID=UPI00341F22FE
MRGTCPFSQPPAGHPPSFRRGPAIDAVRPAAAQARERLALLARRHATIVPADRYPLPQVLGTVVPRGE